MNKIGILFDSFFDNTGDAAMGVVMKSFCEKEKIPYEILDPLSFDPSNYTTIIIGGGFLIRDPGDIYYDYFRLNGANVLNAIGISSNENLEYLNDYSYVSVRSQHEKNLIMKVVKNVEVVPCITTNMKGKPLPGNISIPKNAVAIHVMPTTLNVPGIENVINGIENPIVMMPFTHYVEDRNFMESVAWGHEHVSALPDLSPEQLFSFIGKCEYVVVSSLHASIFAYLQNVPFLVHHQEKVEHYFKDRGLGWHIFKTADELEEKIKSLQSRKVDFRSLVEKDKKTIKIHFQRIKKEVQNSTGSIVPSFTEPIKRPKNKEELILKLQDKLLKDIIYGRDVVLRTKTLQFQRKQKELELDNRNLEDELDSIKKSKAYKALVKLRSAKALPSEIKNTLKL